MKKIILMIVLISGCLSAQSWNSIITTTINEPNLVQLDNLSNRDGVHLVVQNSNSTNSIKYYKMNSSGSVLTTTTIESQGGAEFPSIAGDNDHLYISYRLGNNVITKKYIYSTSTWQSQTSISLNNHDCNRVDNAYDYRGLHIVYSESDGESSYETHYYLYASSTPTKHKVVSDQSEYLGSYPTITLSSNKALVGFNSSGDAKTRDKNLNTDTWENTQSVAISAAEKVQSGCYKLFDFYHVIIPGIIINLYVKERTIDGTTWSSPQLLNYSVNPYIEGMVTSTVTSDGNTHILYDSEQLIHRSYNCSTSSWSDEYEVTMYPGLTQSSSISSVSNDLYAVYRESAGGSAYLKYRQYDDYPLAPNGLTITEDANHHPKLNWNVSPEPDRNVYKIYRYDTYGGGWQYLNQTTNTTFTDQTLTYCHAIPPAQCPDVRTFYFRITLLDYGSHESLPSNQVEARLQGGPPPKIVANPNSDELIEYSMSQNYPNPFNPITTIDYSIQSSGLALLKVYDMLGTEVASLVNEIKEVGNYSVEFNATELPSGIYFYTLTSGNFMATKKLILLK